MITLLSHQFPPDGAAPDWVRLIPAGRFRAYDGRGPWTLGAADAVIAASMGHGPLVLDENHATDLAAKSGNPAPAQGWIVALEGRADGIWGRVEWTTAGQALLAARAYRGISPSFIADKTGRVLRLVRAALTNDPALPELLQLHQREPEMDLEKLREAMGLPADADEAAILAAASAHHQAVQQLSAKVDGMAQTVVTLQAQVDGAAAAAARARATQLVDEAIKAGKPIKALRAHYIDRCTADPVAVEKEFAAMVSLHAGGIVKPPKTDGQATDLTDDDRQVITLMGLDPEAYRKQKAALGQTVEAA